jgi:hypothetical protein
MRRTAIGVGAAATLGATATGGVAAINLPSRETIITAGGIAVSPPLWAAKQVYDRVTDPATGEDVNDQLDALAAEEEHTSVYEDVLEMQSVDDRVITSITNVISGLDRIAYQAGIEVAIERMDLGDSQADVETNAVDAAMEKVSTTQKNLIDHYQIQASKLRRLRVAIEKTVNLAINMMEWHKTDGTGSGNYIGKTELITSETLANGRSYSYIALPAQLYSEDVSVRISDGAQTSLRILMLDPPETGEQIVAWDPAMWKSIWDETTSIASTVESEILSWISTVYPEYQSGDVDLSQLVTADQLAATASEQNDLSNVTADFARLGIPINNRTKLTIEIVTGENSGTIIDGNLAVRKPPTDGFIVGETYAPSTISGPLWLMYDRTTDSGETEGDVYQLESQFKVIDAEGYDGEPVSNVTFEEKTTERYSTDIQELNTQLDKLAEYQQEIQEERDALIEEEATGGGGGFLSGVAQGYSTGVLALAAAGVAWLLSKN